MAPTGKSHRSAPWLVLADSRPGSHPGAKTLRSAAILNA